MPLADIPICYKLENELRLLLSSCSSCSTCVTISVGVATARCKPDMPPDKWITHADQQLYRSKAGGRNQITAITFEIPTSEQGARDVHDRLYG